MSCVELPVFLAEPPFLRQLANRQIPAHREIDDRRGDVERVGALVDEQAHLARPNLVRRLEFHANGPRTEQRHAFNLGLRGVGVHRDGMAVAANLPPQRTEAADDDQQE